MTTAQARGMERGNLIDRGIKGTRAYDGTGTFSHFQLEQTHTNQTPTPRYV